MLPIQPKKCCCNQSGTQAKNVVDDAGQTMSAPFDLTILYLLQMADSALPIGSQSHSFGLETLVSDGTLDAGRLECFLHGYLTEVGAMDGLFCRAGYEVSQETRAQAFQDNWLAVNQRCAAIRAARESRGASAALGKRLLGLAANLISDARVHQAIEITRQNSTEVYHAPVFGFMAGIMALGEEPAVLAFLQQSIGGLLAATQKLMPVGQSQIVNVLWRLKPAIAAAAAASQGSDWQTSLVSSFAPGLDIGSMRHSTLPVRLFIS